MEPWHGGAPTKQLISCSSEECEVTPAVTGETPEEAVERWNSRSDTAKDAEIARYREAANAALKFLSGEDDAGFGTTKMDGHRFYHLAGEIENRLREAIKATDK